MNCLLLKSNNLIEKDTFQVPQGPKLQHLTNHLKLNMGDKLKVSIENQGFGIGEILEINETRALIKIHSLKNLKQREIHLFVGISRPPTMKKILEHGTSLGVTHFHLIGAELSEKSFFDSKIFESDSLQELLVLGVEQSGCFYKIPEVEFIKDVNSVSPVGYPILLHPESEQSYFNIDLSSQGPISLAIGPERGWTSKEVEVLIQKGFKRAHIGSSRLRTEIATFVCLGPLATAQTNEN